MEEGQSSDYSSDESFIRFAYETGVEVVFDGDESRRHLAWRIIEHRGAISKRAIDLLDSFMKDRGVYSLSTIEVFANTTSDGGDFLLRYTFTADHAPREYGYTYFEVIFGCHEPPGQPFWPFKFIVGLH